MSYEPFERHDETFPDIGEASVLHDEQVHAERRQRAIRIFAIASAITLAVAVVVALVVLGRRRPTAFADARRAIGRAPRDIGRRAAQVQLSGPALVERSALRVEEAARELRGLAPALVEQKGREIEALGKAIRIEGAKAAVRGADRLEDAARNVRRAVPPARMRKAA